MEFEVIGMLRPKGQSGGSVGNLRFDQQVGGSDLGLGVARSHKFGFRGLFEERWLHLFFPLGIDGFDRDRCWWRRDWVNRIRISGSRTLFHNGRVRRN